MKKKAVILLKKLGVYEKFIENCKAQGEDLDESLEMGALCVGYAFDWGGTPEGSEFWWEIDDKFQQMW